MHCPAPPARKIDRLIATVRVRTLRLLTVVLLTWCLQMAVAGSTCWGMPMDDDDAAIFFGPRGQPYYAAAHAIETGQSIPVAALAGVKPDIDRKLQEAQITLLQFAWKKGNVPAIGQLMDNGADWRAKLGTEGTRALQDLRYEVLTSDEAKAAPTLAILLAHGLDPNMRDSTGAPILHFPVALRNGPIERGLVEAGADPWATTRDSIPKNAMQIAIENGATEFLLWLIDHGAFDNRPVPQVEGVLHVLAARPRDFAPELADNQRVARAIIERTQLKPDNSTLSLLATPTPHAR